MSFFKGIKFVANAVSTAIGLYFICEVCVETGRRIEREEIAKDIRNHDYKTNSKYWYKTNNKH